MRGERRVRPSFFVPLPSVGRVCYNKMNTMKGVDQDGEGKDMLCLYGLRL